MPLPLDQSAQERQYYLDRLGIVDDPNISLGDLRGMTGGGAQVYSAAEVKWAAFKKSMDIYFQQVLANLPPLFSTLRADIDANTDIWYNVNKQAGVDKTGVADSTAGIQAAIDTGRKEIVIPAGTYKISAALLLATGSQRLTLMAGAVLKPTGTLTKTAVTLSGASCILQGPGKIDNPATWDGTNTAWANSDACVLVSGADCTVQGTVMNNVHKIGIAARDASNPNILDNLIYGNYPAVAGAGGGGWTEVETAHFGICIDPGVDGSSGVVGRNRVVSCVQGVYCGNFNAGASHGMRIVNNILEACHNHALYVAGDYFVIAGNVSKKTSRAFAIAGTYHTVINNTVYTYGSTSSNLDKVASFHMRDAIGCVVVGNTVKGELFGTAWAIDVAPLSLTTGIKHNIIAFNDIDIDDVSAIGGGIRVGSTNSLTDVRRNEVVFNTIRGKGTVNQGLIWILGPTDKLARYNKVYGNECTLTSRSNVIYLLNATYNQVKENTILLDYNDTSATVIGGVALSNATNNDVCNNDFHCEGKGDFVTWRLIYELSASGCAGNRYEGNDFSDCVGSGGANTLVVVPFILNASVSFTRNNIFTRAVSLKGTVNWPTATASVVVTNANVQAQSDVILTPTDAGAGKVMAAPGFYVTKQAGTGFTILTADGTNTAQVSNWSYQIL